MAVSPVQALQDEITCTICLDYFTEPAMIVGCGHNFCRACIDEYWRGASAGVSCPQCRAVFPQPVLTQNRQLGNVVEVARKLSLQSARKAASAEDLCRLHQEPLKLFCQRDRVPVCVVCDRAKEHREHPVVPVEEAAQEQKEQIQRRLETLRQWRAALEESKENGEKASQELLEKTRVEHQRSVAEVETFCQFLTDQVQVLLPQLEELRIDIAQRQAENDIKRTTEIIRLSDLIDDIERKCCGPETEFLKETGSIWDSIEKEQPPQPEEGLADLKERLNRVALRNITVTKTLQRFKGMIAVELKKVLRLYAKKLPDDSIAPELEDEETSEHDHLYTWERKTRKNKKERVREADHRLVYQEAIRRIFSNQIRVKGTRTPPPPAILSSFTEGHNPEDTGIRSWE